MNSKTGSAALVGFLLMLQLMAYYVGRSPLKIPAVIWARKLNHTISTELAKINMSDIGSMQSLVSTINATEEQNIYPELRTHQLIYIPPSSASILPDPGRKFNLTLAQLTTFNLPTKHFYVLNRESVEKFIVVTACDSAHFEESRDAVGSVQEHFPEHTIIYYDLGLENTQVKNLSSWCNVTYRQFNYSQYPDHVTNLRNMAFKMLIIKEVLEEFGSVLWMDASFRAKDHNWTDLYQQALNNSGFVMALWPSIYSNYAFTDPTVYQYFPSDLTKQKHVDMGGGGALLVYNTRQTFWNVLWWIYLCFLDPQCAEPHTPSKKLSRKNPDNFRNVYIGQHRYDQAVIGIILSNLHGYNQTKYITQRSHISITKRPSYMHRITECLKRT